MKTIALCLLFALCLSPLAVKCQSGDSYYALNGKAGLFAVVNDSSFITENNRIPVVLDFESRDISFRFGLDQFYPPLPTGKGENEELELVFKGYLGLDRFETESNHPTRYFAIPGRLDLNSHTLFPDLEGTMDYVGISDDITCRLWVKFDLKLQDFNLEANYPNVYDAVHFELIIMVPKENISKTD